VLKLIVPRFGDFFASFLDPCFSKEEYDCEIVVESGRAAIVDDATVTTSGWRYPHRMVGVAVVQCDPYRHDVAAYG
jgi:hypothetical protein